MAAKTLISSGVQAIQATHIGDQATTLEFFDHLSDHGGGAVRMADQKTSGDGETSKVSSTYLKALKGKLINPSKQFFFEDRQPNPVADSSLREGVDVLKFSAESTKALADPLKWALVGKFSHDVPDMDVIGKFFMKIGLFGDFEFRELNARQILMIFQDECDYAKVWLKTVWMIESCPMRVLKWTPTFSVKTESPIVPAWINFPGLPVHLYEKRALFQIASLIGNPLQLDYGTAHKTRASHARVCIEVDLSKPLKERIILQIGEVELFQQINFENLPHYCSHCLHLGHDLKQCYINGNAPKPTEKKLLKIKEKEKEVTDRKGKGLMHKGWMEKKKTDNGMVASTSGTKNDLEAVGSRAQTLTLGRAVQVAKTGCSSSVDVGGAVVMGGKVTEVAEPISTHNSFAALEEGEVEEHEEAVPAAGSQLQAAVGVGEELRQAGDSVSLAQTVTLGGAGQAAKTGWSSSEDVGGAAVMGGIVTEFAEPISTHNSFAALEEGEVEEHEEAVPAAELQAAGGVEEELRQAGDSFSESAAEEKITEAEGKAAGNEAGETAVEVSTVNNLAMTVFAKKLSWAAEEKITEAEGKAAGKEAGETAVEVSTVNNLAMTVLTKKLSWADLEEENSGKVMTVHVPPKSVGRPKGSRNKSKSVPQAGTADSDRVLRSKDT